MSVSTPEGKGPNVSFERERGVYALQLVRDVAQGIVSVDDDAARNSRILHAFRALAASDVPVFLIKLHSTVITLAFAGSDTARTEQALAGAGLRATTRRDLAVVIVCANLVQDVSSIMVTIADALYSAGVPLLETSDSHNAVHCLIEERRSGEAIAALCRAFHLHPGAVREQSMDAEGAA